MKILKRTLAIILILLALFLGTATYYWAFLNLKVEETTTPSLLMVYKEMTWSYSQTPQAMDEVYYYLMNEAWIETYQGIGIYYDNPDTTIESELKRDAGVIIQEKDMNKVMNISEYQQKILEEKNAMLVRYPYKGSLSTIISLMKVYPILNKYAKEHNYVSGPTIEIYDVPEKTILYYQEIL